MPVWSAGGRALLSSRRAARRLLLLPRLVERRHVHRLPPGPVRRPVRHGQHHVVAAPLGRQVGDPPRVGAGVGVGVGGGSASAAAAAAVGAEGLAARVLVEAQGVGGLACDVLVLFSVLLFLGGRERASISASGRCFLLLLDGCADAAARSPPLGSSPPEGNTRTWSTSTPSRSLSCPSVSVGSTCRKTVSFWRLTRTYIACVCERGGGGREKRGVRLRLFVGQRRARAPGTAPRTMRRLPVGSLSRAKHGSGLLSSFARPPCYHRRGGGNASSRARLCVCACESGRVMRELALCV